MCDYTLSRKRISDSKNNVQEFLKFIYSQSHNLYIIKSGQKNGVILLQYIVLFFEERKRNS